MERKGGADLRRPNNLVLPRGEWAEWLYQDLGKEGEREALIGRFTGGIANANLDGLLT